jgi:hypothetical protein
VSVIAIPRPGVLTGVVVGTFAVPYATDRNRIEHFQIILADHVGSDRETTLLTRDGSLFDAATDALGEMVDAHWHRAVMGEKQARVKVLDKLEAR